MQSSYRTEPGPWQLGPSASRAARWIFGLGLFSTHLGIYLLTGLTLLMVNLYRSPDDLWVGGPLLRWGVVLLIHFLGSVVTWAMTSAFDAATATRSSQHRRDATYYRDLPQVAPIESPAMPSSQNQPHRPRFQPAVSTPVDSDDMEESRRFGLRNWKNEPAAPKNRPSPPGWTVMRSELATPPPPTNPVAPTFTPQPEMPKWTRPAAPVTDAPLPTTHEPASNAVVDPEERWTWVEAAAEAWLAKRDDKSPEGSSDLPPAPITLADTVLSDLLPESKTPNEDDDKA